MKIAEVSFSYDDDCNNEEELLHRHYTSAGWGEALQRRGADVAVVKRFKKDSTFHTNGVKYYFVKDRFKDHLRFWQLPFKLYKTVAALGADVVHVHVFPSSFQVFMLRFFLPRKTAIVVQNHGGKVARGIRSRLNRWMSSVADAFFFTTAEQAKHWFKKQSLLSKVMPVMEGATFFNYEGRDRHRNFLYSDRNLAKKITGMHGSPVFLWVGRLDENKDPLTLLDGIEAVFQKHAGAALYMIYGDDKLSGPVQQRVAASNILKGRVHLLGEVLHEAMEAYYNSADYFVLGSHYEGSGYALSEALGCGCVPVITGIPSFRMMTADGSLGALWETGNAGSFVQAVEKAMQKPLPGEGEACIAFFKNNLSFDAIAGIMLQHYGKLSALRR